METCNVNASNALIKAGELLDIFTNDTNTGIDWTDCKKKLQSVISSAGDKQLKIVLLGSVSDGKTSTIAAITGQKSANMKISVDESSDQIEVYKPVGLKRDMIFVDTPGLFGTKEREVDGRTIKFSKITENYITEADIVLYVTDAIVPVKDSHKYMLYKILRNYNKLSSTIFVINKMDAIVNPRDEQAYNNMSQIKADNLVNRLNDILNLTDTEISLVKGRTVCISADPKEKGIDYWKQYKDDFMFLSRMPLLFAQLKQLADNANVDKLKDNSRLASLKQVVGSVGFLYNSTIIPVMKLREDTKNDFAILRQELTNAETALKTNKGQLRTALTSLYQSVINDISNATSETLGSVVEKKLGVSNGEVTFFILKEQVDAISDKYAENNATRLEMSRVIMKEKFEKQDETLKNLADKGLKLAKNVNASHVLKTRDLLFSSFKFKPWGATKLAGNIGKAAGILGAVIQIFGMWSQYKRNKEAEKCKAELKNCINDYFQEIYSLMTEDKDYYKNFAPSFLDLQQALKERQDILDSIQIHENQLVSFKNNLNKWYGSNIEDVEFEEM